MLLLVALALASSGFVLGRRLRPFPTLLGDADRIRASEPAAPPDREPSSPPRAALAGSPSEGGPRATPTPVPFRAVSVVIPARNEERNLPSLLASLARQTPAPQEILVVDDGSTDRTATLAREGGARVLPSAPLPAGWRGKTWACHQGAAATSGELLLFLDADTWFEPDGLMRLLAGYRGGAFSVGPYHAVRRPHEELSLFFNLTMSFGTVPSGLFGQSLLIDRESYVRGGGHASVRDRVLEHFRWASMLRAAGVAVRSAVGRGILAFRMYPGGLRELMEGWTKGFASGASHTPRTTLLLTVTWMCGLMLVPLVGWIANPLWLWAAGYALCVLQVGWLARQVGAFRWASAVLYPVPLLFFFAVFAGASMRSGKAVRWKGREIRAD